MKIVELENGGSVFNTRIVQFYICQDSIILKQYRL